MNSVYEDTESGTTRYDLTEEDFLSVILAKIKNRVSSITIFSGGEEVELELSNIYIPN